MHVVSKRMGHKSPELRLARLHPEVGHRITRMSYLLEAHALLRVGLERRCSWPSAVRVAGTMIERPSSTGLACEPKLHVRAEA